MIGPKTKVVFTLWLDAKLTIGDESPVARSMARRHKQDCLNFLDSQAQYLAVFGSELSSYGKGLVGVCNEMEESGRNLENDEIGRVYFEVARVFVSWMHCAPLGVLGHEVVSVRGGVDDVWFDEICAWLTRFGYGSFRLVVRCRRTNEEVLVVPIPHGSDQWCRVKNWIDKCGRGLREEIELGEDWYRDVFGGDLPNDADIHDEAAGERNDAIKSVDDHMRHYGFCLFSICMQVQCG